MRERSTRSKNLTRWHNSPSLHPIPLSQPPTYSLAPLKAAYQSLCLHSTSTNWLLFPLALPVAYIEAKSKPHLPTLSHITCEPRLTRVRLPRARAYHPCKLPVSFGLSVSPPHFRAAATTQTALPTASRQLFSPTDRLWRNTMSKASSPSGRIKLRNTGQRASLRDIASEPSSWTKPM